LNKKPVASRRRVFFIAAIGQEECENALSVIAYQQKVVMLEIEHCEPHKYVITINETG
jgi:hypothetical protein